MSTRDVVRPSSRTRSQVRAPLVRRAFDLVSKGKQDRSSVLRGLTSLGLRTRSGKPLSVQTFNAMLRNRLDAGRVNVPEFNIRVRGNFDPIVDEATFDLAQRLLDGKTVRAKPHMRLHPDFPLRGFVRCAACSTGLTGSHSRGRTKRYAYYHCHRCGGVSVRQGTPGVDFHDRVLQELQPSEDYYRLFREVILDACRERQRDAHAVRQDLQRRAEAIRERLDALDDAFIFRKVIDQSSYERQRDKLREDLALVELDLQQATLAEIDFEGVLAERSLPTRPGSGARRRLSKRGGCRRYSSPKDCLSTGNNLEPHLSALPSSRYKLRRRRIQVWRPQRDSNPRFPA